MTTTPRPIPILGQIERLPSTIVVTGSSYENWKNLDPRWFEDVLTRYEGTRLGRQEIDAEILEDIPGTLWTREFLDKCRIKLDGQVEVRKAVAGHPRANNRQWLVSGQDNCT
jgi:phage terminase large subunit-like protein